jgi:hypothetical protein
MIDPRLPQLSREQVYAGLKHFWYDNALSPGELQDSHFASTH